MTNRERILAALHYQSYDRLPLLHFGFLDRTIDEWRREGHLTEEEAKAAKGGDGSAGDFALATKLGFDLNYHTHYSPATRLWPGFQSKVLEELPNGDRLVLTGLGQVIRTNDTNQSIPAHVDHYLKDRETWEADFKHRLEFHPERVTEGWVSHGAGRLKFSEGGREYLLQDDREHHCLLHCGSLYGHLRDYIGVEGLAFMAVDDEPLLDEIIETNADLSYRCVESALQTGIKPDIGHFWEDICYKNGPLVSPNLFRSKVGPHYRRIADLFGRYGIDLVSLDSDGLIDHLLPIWLENGVNVMFPIEVGTWGSSLGPWREQYGEQLLGVGGLNKTVFQHDFAAVEAEVERLRPLVELGGYLPCPDHRLPHDNKWDNVRYYCDRMRQIFG